MMVNTDTRTERRWKYGFNEAGGTWPCSVGLRASVPAAQATQSRTGQQASHPAPPLTCSVILATCIPSKPQTGLQTLREQVWSCRPTTALSTDSQPPEPLPPFKAPGL